MGNHVNIKMKMRMVQLRMSNAELASRAGLTATAISQIVNGHREPRLSTALKIAQELQMSVEELFTEGE